MSDRVPSLVAVINGEWVETWNEWTIDQGRLVTWVEELPLSGVDEGDQVMLTYYGPSEGETAIEFDVPIETIEPAHGGFHVVFDVGAEFVDDVRDLHPPNGQGTAEEIDEEALVAELEGSE